MEQFLQEAVEAKKILSTLSGAKRNDILQQMADGLEKEIPFIVAQNKLDMEAGIQNNLSSALMDRLLLNDERIKGMATALREIAALKDPVGRILDGWVLENGLNIQKVSIPIGVVGIIYESRPNVTSDTAGLCFKSGNVCILKGGKEAAYSNKAIADVLQKVLLQNDLPKGCVALLPDGSREGVANLIKQDKYVDLIVPRGGEKLIKFVNENATVPVVKHDKGLCHIYIDARAKEQMALDIALNAKCQRPGVCNAMETLLVNETIAPSILPKIKEMFEKSETKIIGCEKTQEFIPSQLATEDDWHTEYLENTLSIKIVSDLDEAIEHISYYGSGHSDAIISEDYEAVTHFLNSVDSACVYANASTRFTDGGAFGFGAEVAISTNKLHARGPMGINELTTYKFKILGNGQIR